MESNKIQNYFSSGSEKTHATKRPDKNGKCTYELTNEQLDMVNCLTGCLTDNLRKKCVLKSVNTSFLKIRIWESRVNSMKKVIKI